MPSPALTASAGCLTWAVPPGWVALSSANVGGGLARPRWVANLTVEEGFARTDLDAYVAERLAETGLDLTASGTALLTAADVTQVTQATEQTIEAHPGGAVTAWATVGVTKPTWAASEAGEHGEVRDGIPAPGTINIVVAVPAALTGAALVQAVGTITEAKAQALLEAGVPGTGTASDAVVVLCPEGDAVPFAGVRSPWGQAIARAVHRAVAAGLAAHPWADDRRTW